MSADSFTTVYEERPGRITRTVGRVESFIYRPAHVSNEGMSWKYAFSVLLFNLIGILFLMAVIMLQPYLPFNPQDQGGVLSDLAFNIAVSFVTNTNWQSYAGETTLSYFTQMVGLTVQNFLVCRNGPCRPDGIDPRHPPKEDQGPWATSGRMSPRPPWSFYPICFILALVLVSQGTVQTLDGPMTVRLLQPVTDSNGIIVTEQTVPLDRWPPRRPSRNWALTVVGSSTPTRPIRSRTPRPSPTCWRYWPSDHPGQPMLHLREYGQGPASGDRFADRHAANIHRFHGSGHLG